MCSHLTSRFSPPLVVFQLPYLTARGVPRRRASWQPRRQAVPTTFSRGRLGECLWGQVRESISVPLRKSSPHTSTAMGNVSHVLHSLHPHGAFPVSHLCSCGGGVLVYVDQDMAESSTPSTAPGSVRSTRKGALQVPPAWTVSFLLSSFYVEIANVSFLAAITLIVHTKTLLKKARFSACHTCMCSNLTFLLSFPQQCVCMTFKGIFFQLPLTQRCFTRV